jgi:hypothetical protein
MPSAVANIVLSTTCNERIPAAVNVPPALSAWGKASELALRSILARLSGVQDGAFHLSRTTTASHYTSS